MRSLGARREASTSSRRTPYRGARDPAPLPFAAAPPGHHPTPGRVPRARRPLDQVQDAAPRLEIVRAPDGTELATIFIFRPGRPLPGRARAHALQQVGCDRNRPRRRPARVRGGHPGHPRLIRLPGRKSALPPRRPGRRRHRSLAARPARGATEGSAPGVDPLSRSPSSNSPASARSPSAPSS